MANAVQLTGIAEFRRNVDRMGPVAVGKLRARARAIAGGIQADAAAIARARGWSLANEIVISEDAARGVFIVSVKPTPPRPANLPLWLENGTRYMAARPFFWPGVLRARGRYVAEMEQALQSAYDETVNR